MFELTSITILVQYLFIKLAVTYFALGERSVAHDMLSGKIDSFVKNITSSNNNTIGYSNS